MLHRQRVETLISESKRVGGLEDASSYLTTLRLCKDRRSFRSQHAVYSRYERLYKLLTLRSSQMYSRSSLGSYRMSCLHLLSKHPRRVTLNPKGKLHKSMSVTEDLTALQPVPPKSVGQVFTGGVETSRSTKNGHTGISIKTRLALSHILENGRVALRRSSITRALT
jgi:hypothetical protein